MLPAWVRAADALTVLLVLAALRVAVLGGIRIGTIFSMSTPWRALVATIVIAGLRHYLVRTRPLHRQAWTWLRHAWPWVRPILQYGVLLPSRLVLLGGRRSVSAYTRATRMPAAATLHLFALAALAVAQPLFDMLAREPAFFVARNTTAGQLTGFVVAVSVALPLVLVGIEALFRRLNPGAGTVAHAVLLTALGGLFLLPFLKRVEALDTGPLLAAALLLSGVVAVGCQRFSVVGAFLAALSPAAFVVPGVFLANTGIQHAVVPTADAPIPVRVENAPPIVLVVFDEFPTGSLLDRNRQIDRNRYPHFARFADGATWYRNASTVSSQTVWAVPALVTGKYPVEPNAVPTRRYYPNNLFTMLSGSHRMTVFGRFLQLCPANTCAYDLEVQDSVGDLAADLGIAYLHVVAPQAVASRLPPIVGDWRGFARQRRFRTADGQRPRNERRLEFDRFLETITPERSGRLYFLHSLMPHMPFEYVPSGRRYEAPDYQNHREGGERLFLKSDPRFPLVLQQRHLLQVGAVDRFIGDLIDRLREQGIYDEALIIVTADHGASFRHGSPRRTVANGNVADVMLVPLIVKLPGQTAGAVSDVNVETVDIVPTIAELLSARVPYEIDGRSLMDTSEPGKLWKTFVERNYARVGLVTYPPRLEEPGYEHKLRHFESGLYGLGPHASLVGRAVATLNVRPDAASVWRLRGSSAFANVDVDSATLPLYVRGVHESGSAGPVSLAVGMNGLVVATTESYREDGEWVFGSMIPEDALIPGANDVEIFVIDGAGDRPVLMRVVP